MKNVLLKTISALIALLLTASLCACGLIFDPPHKVDESTKTPEPQQTSAHETQGGENTDGDEWFDEDPDKKYEDPFDKKEAKPLGSTTLNALDLVTFGSYKQNAEGSDKKPIEWIVLKVDGGKALLLSRYVIDTVRYNEVFYDTSWENCSLRRWLAEEFAPEAFGSDVSKLIGTPTPADPNPAEGTAQGGNTSDNIFLMSAAEASNADYGFGKYDMTEDPLRMARPTAYAEAKGCFTAKGGIYDGYADWWLRTLGSNTKQATYVYTDGAICTVGQYIIHKDVGIRPAIWVSLN